MKNNSHHKKIQALWIPSWYPSKVHAFLGSFTRRDAEAVAPYCDLVVLYATEYDGSKYEIETKTAPQGFKEIIVYYPKTNKGKRWLKFWRYFRANKKGWSYIRGKGFRPDLVHVHVIWYAALFAIYLCWKNKLPYVITEHWSGYHDGKKQFSGVQKFVARYFVPRAERIMAVSSGQMKAMKGLGLNGKYQIVPNVVDTRNIPPKKKREKGPCRFVHVSSFHDEQKNISGLFRAVKKLSLHRKGFLLTMVGGLDHVPYFQEMAKNMGLSRHIRFTGMLPHEKVMEALTDGDVFVLFSNHEGLPCTMLEAMAVGLPVICTAIKGMEEWITEETGILVPIADEEALEKAMEKMMDNYRKYNPEKICRIIEDNCSYEIFGKKIQAVYREVLQK